MKVSEVKKRIDVMECCLDSVNRMQEYFGEHAEENKRLKDEAGMSCMPYDLLPAVANVLYREIKRLGKIIDDADVQI